MRAIARRNISLLVTFKIVSYCPAAEASSESSPTAEERATSGSASDGCTKLIKGSASSPGGSTHPIGTG